MKSISKFAFVAIFALAFIGCENPVLAPIGSDASGALEKAPFSLSNELRVPRSEVSAVVMNDGRILVAGGKRHYEGYFASIASAELYSAKKGSQSVRKMLEARAGHTLTLLADGRVLAVGGSYQDSRCRYFAPPVRSTAEIFNPRTGRWTMTGSMRFPRANHGAALLADGKVLVAGERLEAETWDPATGEWAVVGSLTYVRYETKLVPLADGRVLVLGMTASTDSDARRTAEVYYPENGTFKLTLPMNCERAGRFSATLLADGRVMVAGGDVDTGKPSSVEIFDPMTGEWTFVGRLTTDRVGHGACLLSDGSVLISGGEGIVNRDAPEAEWFSAILPTCDRVYPTMGDAVPAGELSVPRANHGFFFVNDSRFGTVYALGGYDSNGSTKSVDLLTWR